MLCYNPFYIKIEYVFIYYNNRLKNMNTDIDNKSISNDKLCPISKNIIENESYLEKIEAVPEIKYDYTYLLMKTCFIDINNYDKNLLIKIGKFIDEYIRPSLGTFGGINQMELKNIYDTFYATIFDRNNTLYNKSDIMIDDLLDNYINIHMMEDLIPSKPYIYEIFGWKHESDILRCKQKFISTIITQRKSGRYESRNIVNDINLYFEEKEKIIYNRKISLFFDLSCCYIFIKNNGSCLIYITRCYNGTDYCENYKMIDITLSKYVINIINSLLNLIDKEKNIISGYGSNLNTYKEDYILSLIFIMSEE